MGFYHCLRSYHPIEIHQLDASARLPLHIRARGCMHHIISRGVLARHRSSSSATSCCADEQQDASSMHHAECCVHCAVNTKLRPTGLKLRGQRNRQRARHRHADEPKLVPSAPWLSRVVW